ncbi:MAG: 4-alpha-glucanotransferase [Verrucomicrobia bacterium]|nr:4-alpha-glucanotransferase [Verrucomicrobiota bacterium]
MDFPLPTWLNTRTAGVLAHVSSLPGEHGIGNLGPGARRFIDFLATAGFRYWQICPIGPTGYGDSPYQLFSSNAGNPYFIDLGELATAGLIHDDELAPLHALPSGKVDYGELYAKFWPVLARAYDRYAATGRDGLDGYGSLEKFCQLHASWLEPFAHFMALKSHFGGYPWNLWPEDFRRWSPDLQEVLPPAVREDAARHIFYQYVFFAQWNRLRRYAAERGVGLIGDVPIFVALDSADVWQNHSVFRLDNHGRPLAVAGVPPDYFSSLGQLWGNPLYDWEYLARTGYTWWLARLRAAFALYDVIRLDHFRGFDTYWEVPFGAADARCGRWLKGPGLPFFKAVQNALPEAKIIAEDLGYIGPGVVDLRRASGLPGMKILQFAYGHDANNVNLPHFYPQNSVAYTGTHDNITTRGWLESITQPYAQKVSEYFHLNGSCSAWPMIRAAFATPSRLAVIPMQDLLDLPASATLNRPGTTEGNWQWRFTTHELDELAGERTTTLKQWIDLYDRSGTRVLRDYSEPPTP